jgi:DNA-binding MarR family transcriptional regulator
MIEKNTSITQREISKEVDISVSMVNNYLVQFEKRGYITRKHHSSKSVDYIVSRKGSERKKVLNICYLNATQKLYNSAKDNIVKFLDSMVINGFSSIVLYGAGEVAEILLHTIDSNVTCQLNILAIIDDDMNKQGLELLNRKIISIPESASYKFDRILISSYTNRLAMIGNLSQFGYDKNIIIDFFDIVPNY